MEKKIIIGNWKNYLNYEESIHLSKKISKINISNNVRVMVSPNHLYLKEINQIFNETKNSNNRRRVIWNNNLFKT